MLDSTIQNLLLLVAQNEFNAKQVEFIVKIIEGTDGVIGLKALNDSVNIEKVKKLAETISDEINANNNYPKYQSILRAICIRLQKTLERYAKFNSIKIKVEVKDDTFLFPEIETSHKYLDYAKRRDELYKRTNSEFHGIIQLPITQGADYRMEGKGQCFGYTMEWIRNLFSNGKAFGIDPNMPPPFTPIKWNSYLGTLNCGLNHLVPLSPVIMQFQDLQSGSQDVELMTHLLQPVFINKNQKKVTKSIISGNSFFLRTRSIANKLVKVADENPDDAFEVALYGYEGGHSIGFKKIGSTYHLMDASSGWFAFKNAEDFKKWLPFYFKQMDYKFSEYEVNAYHLSAKDDAVRKTSVATRMKKAFSATIFIPFYITLFSFKLTAALGRLLISPIRALLRKNPEPYRLPMKKVPIGKARRCDDSVVPRKSSYLHIANKLNLDISTRRSISDARRTIRKEKSALRRGEVTTVVNDDQLSARPSLTLSM